jgi:hypothetical protein
MAGTPVVALPETFKKTTGNVGVVGGVFPPVGTTSVCALIVPTAAVTSAVSLEVSVADATPFTPVATCAGAIVPRVVANVTTTFGNPAPFTFCTVADTVAVPACVPVVRTPRDAKQRQDNGNAGEFLQHGHHDAEMDTAVVPVVTWPVVSMTVTVTV